MNAVNWVEDACMFLGSEKREKKIHGQAKEIMIGFDMDEINHGQFGYQRDYGVEGKVGKWWMELGT